MPNHEHEIHLIDSAGAFIQSKKHVVKNIESTAEIQGTEVHSSNSMTMVRVKEWSVLTRQDARMVHGLNYSASCNILTTV